MLVVCGRLFVVYLSLFSFFSNGQLPPWLDSSKHHSCDSTGEFPLALNFSFFRHIHTVAGAKIVLLVKTAIGHVHRAVHDVKILKFVIGRHADRPARAINLAGRQRAEVVQRRGKRHPPGPGCFQVEDHPVRLPLVIVGCSSTPCKAKGNNRQIQNRKFHVFMLTARIEFSPPKSSFSRMGIVGSGIRLRPSIM